jgi:hypothetical protein
VAPSVTQVVIAANRAVMSSCVADEMVLHHVLRPFCEPDLISDLDTQEPPHRPIATTSGGFGSRATQMAHRKPTDHTKINCHGGRGVPAPGAARSEGQASP